MEQSLPTKTWYAVAKTSELAPGEMMYVEVGKKYEPVCLINLDGEFYALNDCCTHEDASLSDGTIERDEIACPPHCRLSSRRKPTKCESSARISRSASDPAFK